jgi:phage-related protein
VLGDVHAITARISQHTERVDHAISGTIERVDETAEHVVHRVRDKVAQATGVVRGIRAAIASVLTTEPAKPPAQAGGSL